MLKPTHSTAKMLFGLSGNICSYRNCKIQMIQNGTVIGQICHIEAESLGGPRYNPNQTDEERRIVFDRILEEIGRANGKSPGRSSRRWEVWR